MKTDVPALVDEPSAPRESEQLDVAALEPWLRENLAGFDGTLGVQQFRKGHSNLTYFVSDGTRGWVLRRPPFGTHVATAHDMGREYRILSKLHAAYPKAPEAVAFCDDPSVIGAPFYVMERMVGLILRNKVPEGIAFGEQERRALGVAFVQEMADIHGVDLERCGLEELGRPKGYVERQVSGWTRRYRKSQTDEIDEMDEVAAWLADSQPAEADGTLIHNDFKYDNCVLDPNDTSRIIGVLDWEMATLGDPLMDLGTTLGYWLEPEDPPELHMLPFGIPAGPGRPTRAELAKAYSEATGRSIERLDFYYVFGLFKIAVVAQQIYYRFASGKTDDPRFAMMIQGVRILSAQAARVVRGAAV